MVEKLKDFESQLESIDSALSDSTVMKDMKKYAELTQERSRIAPIVDSLRNLASILSQIEEAGLPVIELVVAYRHGVESGRVHPGKDRHPVFAVAFKRALEHVAGGEDEGVFGVGVF